MNQDQTLSTTTLPPFNFFDMLGSLPDVSTEFFRELMDSVTLPLSSAEDLHVYLSRLGPMLSETAGSISPNKIELAVKKTEFYKGVEEEDTFI